MIRACIFSIARAISPTESIPRSSMKCCAALSRETANSQQAAGNRLRARSTSNVQQFQRCSGCAFSIEGLEQLEPLERLEQLIQVILSTTLPKWLRLSR